MHTLPKLLTSEFFSQLGLQILYLLTFRTWYKTIYSLSFLLLCVSERGEERGRTNHLGKSLVFKADNMDKKTFNWNWWRRTDRQNVIRNVIRKTTIKWAIFFWFTLLYSKYAIILPISGWKKQISIPDCSWDLKSSVSVVGLNCCSWSEMRVMHLEKY